METNLKGHLGKGRLGKGEINAANTTPKLAATNN